MKKSTSFITFLAVYGFSIVLSHAQESQDSQARKLPQIKLEDYTIIGLEKVDLPRKERRTIAKKIRPDWSENSFVRLKESPSVSFKSPQKPGMEFFYEFPDVNVLTEYGSFNTFGVDLKTRFSAGEIIPLLAVNYRRSDGHVDKADYKRAAISGGVEGQAWKNGVFQLVGRYRNDEQNLWSSLIPTDSVRKAKTDLWHWQAKLDQKLGQHFSVFTHGHFQQLDFDNRFNYTQSLLSVKAGGIFATGQTSMQLSGKADHNNTKRNASLTPRKWDAEYSLYSTTLRVNQRMSNFSVGAGINAQHLEIKSNSSESKTYLYPVAEIEFNGNNIFHLFARYQPGFEFQSMEQMLKAHPFADFDSFQPQKMKHRAIGGINLKANSNMEFKLFSTYEEFENYPITYSSLIDTSTTSPTSNSILNYPYSYWEYRYVDDAKILENSLRMELKFPKVLIEGWLTHRWNELKTVDEHDSLVSGNNIPYLPELNGNLKLIWYFFRNHKLQISGEYIGERFNDVANSIVLKDHIQLHAMVNFVVAKPLNLKFFGRNLLDQDYQLYHTYSAPGINGGVGLELKF